MNNNTKKQKNHWFNLADGIIIALCLALTLWAVFVYLAPTDSDNEAENIKASIIVDFSADDSLTEITKGDAVFCGEKRIGEVITVDSGVVNSVHLSLTLQKGANGVELNGEQLFVNGSFTLETRIRCIEGTIYQITLEEDE